MPGRREQRERERKRAAVNCQKLDSFLPLAKRQTPLCVETQTTSSASTAVDSTACNSSSLLGSEASADEPDTNVDVVEDQDCHFERKAGEDIHVYMSHHCT